MVTLWTVFVVFAVELVLFTVNLAGEGFNQKQIKIEAFSKDLGWDLIPNSSKSQYNTDFLVTYNIDSDGFRKTVDQYSRDQSRKKIIVLGDSFVFGIGVKDEETMVSVAQKNLVRYQLINAGVSGYSPDQELIRFEKIVGSKFKDDIDAVILTIYLGNDMDDLPLPFPSQAERPKPYFVHSNGTWKIKNDHVNLESKRKLTSEDSVRLNIHLLKKVVKLPRIRERLKYILRLAEPPPPDDSVMGLNMKERYIESYSQSLKILSEILNRFQKIASPKKIKFGVMIIPYLKQIHGSHPQFDFVAEQVEELLKRQSIPYTNLTKPMKDTARNGEVLYLLNEGHWNRRGNELAAEHLVQFIQSIQ